MTIRLVLSEREAQAIYRRLHISDGTPTPKAVKTGRAKLLIAMIDSGVMPEYREPSGD